MKHYSDTLDKLFETEIEEQSAASVLNITNKGARRYANYLLNGIHLCENIDELHEHPKGGITKDGMLCKSYAASLMQIQKTQVCLGNNVVKFQLEQAKKELERLILKKSGYEKEIENRNQLVTLIDNVEWKAERYNFNSSTELSEENRNLGKLSAQIEELKNSPEMLAAAKEYDLAMKNALKLGELDSVKVENMVEQNRVLNEKRESEKAEMKEYGIISVCSGKGMEAIFNDLGIDKIVEGGQTMNPSVYDILSMITVPGLFSAKYSRFTRSKRKASIFPAASAAQPSGTATKSTNSAFGMASRAAKSDADPVATPIFTEGEFRSSREVNVVFCMPEQPESNTSTRSNPNSHLFFFIISSTVPTGQR